MIRKPALLGALILVAARLSAQTIQTVPSFRPDFPGTRAMGNAVVASAQGFESLYSNPAAFARGKLSFTLVSAAPTLGARLDAANLNRLSTAWSSPSSADTTLSPLFDSGGFGFSAAAGIGYAGSGLGLGLLLGGQTFGASPSDLSARATLAFVGGMGVKIGKHLLVGGAVRPMFQVFVPDASIAELLSFLQSPASSGFSVPSLYGVGVAMDAGAIADFGSFSYGLAVSDIGGTRLSYAQGSLGLLASSLIAGGGLPTGQALETTYMVPMKATVGAAFHPRFGSAHPAVEPTIEVDYAYLFDPNNMLRPPTSLELLDGIHAGLDLGLFSFLHLRAGYQYGRVSGGVGLQFPGIRVDAMLFQQVAPSGVSGPAHGLSAGVSIRF